MVSTSKMPNTRAHAGYRQSLLLGSALALLAGAAAAQTAPAQRAPAPAAASAPTSELSEVIVTAEKRSDKVLQVPATVQAVSGARLETLAVKDLADLQGFVPALTLNNYGAPGINTLEIRGLGDGYLADASGPLVATYVDDFAVGSSTSAGRGNTFGLDLIPYDIDHVEVLEGPQGTLYGADAMGGIIKYTLKQPNTSQFSGGLGGDVAHEHKSGSADFEARGYLNIPVIDDQLAVRISAFDKNNGGYINNIGISKKNSNSSNEAGGRFALIWTPTDKFTLKASAVLQDVHATDVSAVTLNGSTGRPLYGPNINNTVFPQPFTQHFSYYNVGGSYDFDFATLSSVVGYSHENSLLKEDFTPYAAFTGVPGAIGLWMIHDQVSKFSEETRLTSKGEGRLSWIVGQYYTRETASEHDSLPTFTSTYVPLPPSDNVLMINNGSLYEEVSVFGDVTYKLTDNFDITGGGRWTHYSQDTTYSTFGIAGHGPAPDATIVGNTETWMANARYHINKNEMVYFRVATGFRPGTANPITPPGVPHVSSPDKTIDYEIGYKAALFENRLQVTATAFHIDWKDIQEAAACTGAPGNCSPAGFDYIVNSGTAISNGVELAASYRATHDLTLGLNAAVTDAHLTSDSPLVGGTKGDQLPLSAKFVGSVTADYVHPISDQFTIIAGVSYRHKDQILDQFPGNFGGAFPLPAQDIVSAYTGTTFGPYSVRIYAKNIFNNRSYSGMEFILNPAAPRAIPVQPQTFGISFDYRFN